MKIKKNNSYSCLVHMYNLPAAILFSSIFIFCHFLLTSSLHHMLEAHLISDTFNHLNEWVHLCILSHLKWICNVNEYGILAV